MTSIARHLSIGFMALCTAFAMIGCTSDDAGSTLSVKFTTGASGFVVSRTTAGTAATSTAAATPDIYTGSTNVVAKVVYTVPSTVKNPKTLVYKWTFWLPGSLGATATTDNETLSIDATVSTALGTAPNIGDGVGQATLEVYEKDGTLYEKASTPIYVSIGFGG